MKKLLLGLACAASLGLWMSCSDSNELDVTVHDDIESVTYNYAGTVTATRYVYKPVELGTTKPASGKYYFIGQTYDSVKGETVTVNKYFHNAWVADKTPVTDKLATMSWRTDISGATQTNMTTYTFSFNGGTSISATINKSGNTYAVSRINGWSINGDNIIALTAGTLDGTTFTIKELPYDSNNGTLPDEDSSYYYNSYNSSPQNYDSRYVTYGNITYTRGQ